jgi:hypothetical protein
MRRVRICDAIRRLGLAGLPVWRESHGVEAGKGWWVDPCCPAGPRVEPVTQAEDRSKAVHLCGETSNQQGHREPEGPESEGAAVERCALERESGNGGGAPHA